MRFAMNTVVFQSFRSNHLPTWIGRCMQTVREWAASRGFAYRFIDDRAFEHVPDWLRRRAPNTCTKMDLSRLVLARELLCDYERAVWVDADIVIFAPERMEIPESESCFFSREIWFSRAPVKGLLWHEKVNNSVTGFRRGNAQLDFLIDACERIARHSQALHKLDLGTRLLSRLNELVPLPLLDHVGMFSPLIMASIARGLESCLQAYARHLPAQLACANLCMSFQGMRIAELQVDEALSHLVIDRCLQTRGSIVNRFVAGDCNARSRRSAQTA